ncbi:molybdate ABC transporter substrate-binding protein [Indioceanicola profundi]|uniref:molybdate ABC transporter substrate-binding protein n=1 Tax=Indioceanicola profundi TaxID=2220096 RepID=UPI000E6AD3CE|nr:molybdate ABC transporter substrate-binding protein [Indioceanicola profundi]
MPRRRRLILAAAMFAMLPGMASAADAVKLHAAGSLKSALTELAMAFTTDTGIAVDPVFGPSGLLRDRLAGGEPGHVFASANMEHPQALHAAGLTGPVRPFARNTLCALVGPDLADIGSAQLLDMMLAPDTRLGISTPKADPSGDYALALFAKVEAVRPGSAAALDAKAQRLTGGPDAPTPSAGRNIYAHLVETGAADIFLTYCTNSLEAARQVPELRSIAVPNEVSVGAEYGVTLLKGAPDAAGHFVNYLQSPEGRAILRGYGFSSPGS